MFLPDILKEASVRTFLQSLYIAVIGSSENAQILTNYSYGNVNYSLVKGNRLVRNCMYSTLRWLERIERYTAVLDDAQINSVYCSKQVAEYILNVRSLSTTTCSLNGIVFSISKPYYDKNSNAKIVTISLIIPELGCAMSIRCPPYLINTLFSFYEFSGVQPVPYTNRIHPTKLSIKQMNKTINLDQLEFLYVCFEDISKLSLSLAFENYCEIESEQANRRLLGIPCIISGRLTSFKNHRITLQNVINKYDTIEMVYKNNIKLNSEIEENLYSLTGKYVQILCIYWYSACLKDFLFPEAILIEQINDIQHVIRNDIIGFVRGRGRVSKEQIFNKYSEKNLEELYKHVKIINDEYITIHYGTITSNSILQHFINHNNNIIQSRTFSKTQIQTTEINIFPTLDNQIIKKEKIEEFVEREESIFNTIINLIKLKDYEGKTISYDDLRIDKNSKNFKTIQIISWLEDIGLVKNSSNNITITTLAYSILEKFTREYINKTIQTFKMNNKYLINLIEIEEESHLPSSLLLKALGSLEKDNLLQCSRINNHRCKLFWHILQDNNVMNENQEIESLLKPILFNILKILSSLPYSLTDSKILELLRNNGYSVGYKTLKLILSELDLNSSIVRDGDSWSYRYEKRVKDLLFNNNERTYSLENIMMEVSIPKIEISQTLNILNNLSKQGEVKEILRQQWTRNENIEEKFSQAIFPKVSELIMKTLSNSKFFVDEDRLISGIWHYAHTLNCCKLKIDHHKICRDILNKLINNDYIHLINGRFILNPK